jgi:hypoxanthine phosphoribosyltransferase
VTGEVLFSQREIAGRVEDLAREIVARKPEIAVPILIGSFVFAADLLRALARQGLSLPTEFLWLRSYDGKAAPGDVSVIAGAGEAVRGKSVLLIDGVLDRGATVVKARALLKEAGAKSVLTAVAVDKLRGDAVAHADFALFHGVTDFIAGYGMDHAGAERGLPDIVRVE